MLYNLSEKLNTDMFIKIADKPVAIMVTDEDASAILQKALPYAIEHEYGVFRDSCENILTKGSIPQKVMEKGLFVDTEEGRKQITLMDVLSDVMVYASLHLDILDVPDEVHTPKTMKPGVIYSIVRVKELSSYDAAQILDISK